MAGAVKVEESGVDPGGVEAAINRYRDLAKYLVTIFAAVGALLATGSQLSSIGKLSPADDALRLGAAVLALGVAIAAVFHVIQAASKVLRPVEISLDTIIGDTEVKREIERRPGLLLGTSNVKELKRGAAAILADEPDATVTPEEQARWREGIETVLDRAAVIMVRRTFEAAWKTMRRAGLLGAAAIAVFAWAANPGDDETPSDVVVSPAPALVEVSLTAAGREALGEALGEQCTERNSIRALSVGGEEGAPELVTLPERGCAAAQFTLAPELGYGAGGLSAPQPSTPTP